MDYTSIRGEYLPDYTKNVTWNLLHAYMDEHSQRFIYEYPGDGVQTITIFQYQCANMIFSDQSRYDRLFKKGIHKGGESEINYIKRFQNANDLELSVGNIYSEYQLMNTLLEIFSKVEMFCPDGKPSSRIEEIRKKF